MQKENYRYPGQDFRKMFDESLAANLNLIKSNPENAVAQAGLAESLINLWCYAYIPREDAFAKAKPAIEKALSLDKNFGKAYTINGIIKFSEWNWDEAETNLKKGIELSPNNSEAHHWYALYLSAMNRFDESIEESKKSYELNKTADGKVGISSIYYFAHEFEIQKQLLEPEATPECKNAAIFDWLGMAYVQLKQFDKAIEVYKKAVELSDRNSEIMGGIGHAYGMAGNFIEARKVLNEMLEHLTHCYVPPVQIAFVYASLSENDKAMDMLDRAFEERSWELAFINVEPWFDDFHNEPRFKDLLGKINFPQK